MTSSRFHVPPANCATVPKLTGSPPDAGPVLSLLSAKKPMHCASGKKNGVTAPSVLQGETAASEASAVTTHRALIRGNENRDSQFRYREKLPARGVFSCLQVAKR
jgi:hypothetical protein